jgi:hypothetical protein
MRKKTHLGLESVQVALSSLTTNGETTATDPVEPRWKRRE